MGSVVYSDRFRQVVENEVNSVLVDLNKSNKVQETLGQMWENGQIKEGMGTLDFNLGEVIANGIEEGVKRAFKWFGGICLEGVKILWGLIVDLSFYGCLFTATGAILMTYCGSKKYKKTIVVSIVLYVLIQMINGILIEQGFIG